MTQQMEWTYDDGGRSEAGYKGDTGDCGVRSIAIATRLTYQEVYDQINLLAQSERTGKRKKHRSNARTGVYRQTMDKFLVGQLGWTWTPTMQIGSGCKVHLRSNELPGGRLIARLSKHFVAVIDGIIHDTCDPSRDGTRCVYGYWEPTN